MREIVLDCRLLQQRAEANEYLKQVFGFPNWYGRNMDAFHDFLSELSDVRIILTHPEELDNGQSYCRRVFRVIRDVSENQDSVELVIQEDEPGMEERRCST